LITVTATPSRRQQRRIDEPVISTRSNVCCAIRRHGNAAAERNHQARTELGSLQHRTSPGQKKVDR
jgi:hypothetical protein